MNDTITVRALSVGVTEDAAMLRDFLARHALGFEADIDAAFGVFDEDEVLRGCGCAAGSLLKCFAVDKSLRGQNALGALVSRLVQDRFAKGCYDLRVITRAHNEPLFAACGFYPVVRTNELVLLENRPDGPRRFAQSFFRRGDEDKIVGAIVMNANPFTLGHRALVEYAAARCDVLHLFVVEEDRSLFPTDVRFRLVQEGTADLANVRVHLSGQYMISSTTFPTYFLKDGGNSALLQSELDITLFASSIAPVLHITRRFAGEEPLDPVTACYNSAMRGILPRYGIEYIEISRLALGDAPVSASRVRALIKRRQYREAQLLVPEPTRRLIESLEDEDEAH